MSGSSALRVRTLEAGRGSRPIHGAGWHGALFLVAVLVCGCSGQAAFPSPEQDNDPADAGVTSSEPVVDPPAADVAVSLPAVVREPEEASGERAEDAAVRVPVSSPPTTSSPPETSGSTLVWPVFVEQAAPSWPFEGVVQLWANVGETASGEAGAVWWLRYWSEGLDVKALPAVPLAGLEVECLGRVGMVSHGERGIEVGGSRGAASGSYLVAWGEAAQRLDGPSGALLAEIDARPSTMEVGSSGDAVSLAAGGRQVSYAMRRPARQAGDWWRVQARHDGDVLVMTVHPVNHECFSGVTWLADASTGEVVGCGANTWATRFVGPDNHRVGELALPDPDDVGSYLGCGARLELTDLRIRVER